MYCSSIQGVRYQRISNNVVLHLSHSIFLKLNKLQSGQPTNVSLIILQCSGACTELWLTFSNVCRGFFLFFMQILSELPLV